MTSHGVALDPVRLRVQAALYCAPGSTAEAIVDWLRRGHYVADLVAIRAALRDHPSDFRSEFRDGQEVWFALRDTLVHQSIREPHEYMVPPEPPSLDVIMVGVRRARYLRGDPELDEASASQVAARLMREAGRPQRRSSFCWACHDDVDDATNEKCVACNWLVCWCGACRKGCRFGAWALAQEREVPTADYRGEAILTALRPTQDAPAMRDAMAEWGGTSLYHWSPAANARSILELGLLSSRELVRRAIRHERHGYGSRAKAEALYGFVCTSFAPKMWMAEAWSDSPLVWAIDAEAATTIGTLFVGDNTAKASVDLSIVLASEGADACRRALRQWRVDGAQAEILIPERVMPAAVRAVKAFDREVADWLERAVAELGATVEVKRARSGGLAAPLARPDPRGHLR